MTSPVDQAAYLLKDLSLLGNLSDNARQEVIKHLIPLPKAPLKQECPFFDKLPPEIRNDIYRLILVNPNLAERSFVEKDNQFSRHGSGDPVAYGLSPALLTTCKQMYQEASHILYEENTFLILFYNNHGYPVCPLARYPAYRHGFNESVLHPTMKVRRWKIIVDISNLLYDNSFKYICRLLADSPPRSLEISLEPSSDIWPESTVQKWLKPLRQLRNIDKFTLSEVDSPIVEVTANILVSSTHLLSRMQGWDSLKGELQNLAEGNSPVELLPEMYNRLVLYYASFERYELFRHMIEQEYRCDPDSHLGLIGQGGHRIKQHNPLQLNTFRHDYPPLSSTLSNAYLAVIKNEDDQFKIHRSKILNHLEPQYQRIVAASRRMSTFVKEQKLHSSIFDTNHPTYIYPDVYWTDKHYECVEFLEKYADALKTRNFLIEDQIVVNLQRDFVETHYRSLPAESAIRELRLVLQCEGHFGFRDLFQRALDDLDSQYLIIRTSRTGLYSCDRLNEPGCTIGLDEDSSLQ